MVEGEILVREGKTDEGLSKLREAVTLEDALHYDEPPAWMIPANLYLRYAMRRYTTTTEGFDRPWRALEALLPDLRVEPLLLGGAYVASGTSSRDG